MGTCKALIVAGAAFFGVAGAAFAADLPPPPPPPMEYAPEPVAFSGWYLRADVGVGASQSADLRSTFDDGFVVPDPRFDESSIGDSAFAGAGVGYQFNSWLRFDVTGEYRTAQSLSAIQSYDCSSFGCGDQFGDTRAFDKYTGHVQSIVALFNAYADIGTWYGFTPFVGVGVGGAFNHVSSIIDTGVSGPNNFGVGGFGYSRAKDSTDLAYAVMAGVSYAISPNLKFEVAYRYLDMGDIKTGNIVCQNTGACGNEVQNISLASQDIKLGMRWMFTDIAPEPAVYAPPPIIRKD